MLNRLLNLLQEGGTHRIGDLAEELGTTYEMVEAMLEDLERMGYVKRAKSECSGACSACPVSDVCAAGGSPPGRAGTKIWVLTEKSKKVGRGTPVD
ncbi:MAG: FeoC-like transcriptional regulator [Chloroflexota bacterium]